MLLKFCSSWNDLVYLQISDAFVFVDVSPLSLLKYTLFLINSFSSSILFFGAPDPALSSQYGNVKRILRWIHRFYKPS